MMAGPNDDDTDKSHEPTQHKLDEARKKGEIAKSADLNTAASYCGFLLAALAGGAWSVDSFSTSLAILLDQASSFSLVAFNGSAAGPMGGLLFSIIVALSVWFLTPAATALLSVVAQRSLIFAPSKLKPKASRINPVQNAKNKYGWSGLFEFFKSFLKLLLFSVLLAFFLSYRLPDMAGSLHAESGVIGMIMGQILIEFLFIVLLIAVSVGVLDYTWHYYDHLRRNRMSHREVKDEHKQQEGDPHMKQERRQRASQIANSQMMSDVPKADVVIVNPTHYAVALKWARTPGSAPEVVAKGVDHVAKTIREIAMENGVPIRSDPPTARAIFATTEIGQQIDPSHYRAVAVAIRFAETIRRRARYWS